MVPREDTEVVAADMEVVVTDKAVAVVTTATVEVDMVCIIFCVSLSALR